MAFNAPIKRNEGVKPLRGTEKVAALLLAMGRELSSGVLKEFDPDEIKIVTRAGGSKADFYPRARSHYRGVCPKLLDGTEHFRDRRRT